MQTTILNYRIIIEPDKQTGTGKPGFSALCPTLGIADDGKTIEEARNNLQKAIKIYVDYLNKENLPIPTDKPETDIVTTTQIKVDYPVQFA